MNISLATVGIPLITLVALLSTIVYVDASRTTYHRAQERTSAVEKLHHQRERLEHRLHRSMSNSEALRSFVLSKLTTQEPINNKNFTAFAETLPNVGKIVLGLQLAPDGIIRFVIPESDISLVGMELTKLTSYNRTVHRAITTRRMIVDGPRKLSQGVQGLVVRLPIFTPDRQFWGFSTVVIDFESLAAASELDIVIDGLRLAIRGKDGKGSKGEVFFGDAELFDLDPILVDIKFQNGSWQLAGIPLSGWSNYWPGRNIFIVVTIIISLLISILIWRNSQHKYQLSLNEKLLRTLAAEDSLTKLANRRTLQNHLEEEWKRATRMKTPLSLLMIDIDFFKKYNDQFGHLEGDNCLCLVANVIAAAAKRPSDLAARFGGEEFVLVLPDTTLDNALSVAENLRLEVVSKEIHHSDNVPMEYVTVSIGVASCIPSVEEEPERQKSIQLLLEYADKYMYRAKEKGRNRVESTEI